MSKSSGGASSTSTTVLIPNDVYEKIEFEASSHDLHVSTIINSILRKYATYGEFYLEMIS